MKTDAFTHIVAKRDHETLGRVRTEPSDAKHGFRNLSQDPVVQLITINSEPGRLFWKIRRAIARGARPCAPSPDELRRIVKTCERYGVGNHSRRERFSRHSSFYVNVIVILLSISKLVALRERCHSKQ